MPFTGRLGSVAFRTSVAPAQWGVAAGNAALLTNGVSGVPLQFAGAASKPNTAVSASAPVDEPLLVLPYMRPFLPDTVNWLTVMPLDEVDVWESSKIIGPPV